MAAVMALGLTGCGNDTAGSASSTETADTTRSAASSEENEDSDYYPVTVEVYNASKELVPYTFEKWPEKTLVYGRNNVEIMLSPAFAVFIGFSIPAAGPCTIAFTVSEILNQIPDFFPVCNSSPEQHRLVILWYNKQ